MIFKKLITYAVLLTFISTTSFSPVFANDRVRDAVEFANQTHIRADQIGLMMADQDALQLITHLTDQKNTVNQELSIYVGLAQNQIAKLREEIKSANFNVNRGNSDRQAITKAYDKLKTLIRERYALSWTPTILDNDSRVVVDSYSHAAQTLKEECKAGLVKTQDALPDGTGLTEGPPVQPGCMFFASTPPIGSTQGEPPNTPDNHNSNQNYEIPQNAFSCYGPRGSNDWVSAANYLGETAVVAGTVWGIAAAGAAAGGAAAAAYGAVAGVALTAGLATFGVGAIVALIGFAVIMGQAKEEGDSVIYANEIKIGKTATTSDIVASYRNQCEVIASSLEAISSDLYQYTNGTEEDKKLVIKRHNESGDEQNSIQEKINKYYEALCRYGKRQNVSIHLPVTCALPDASEDKNLKEQDDKIIAGAQSALTFPLLMKQLDYAMIEQNINLDKFGVRNYNRDFFSDIDRLLEVSFQNILSMMNLENSAGRITGDTRFKALDKELKSDQDWLTLRKRYLGLVAEAVDVIFGTLTRQKFRNNIAAFSQDLNLFNNSHVALQGETSIFIESIVNLRELTL